MLQLKVLGTNDSGNAVLNNYQVLTCNNQYQKGNNKYCIKWKGNNKY